MMLRSVQRDGLPADGASIILPLTKAQSIIDPEKDERHHDILREFVLRDFDEAPRFLATNPFIRTGYRVYFSLGLCSESIFRRHNETGNIWTHLLAVVGLVLLFVLSFRHGVFDGSLWENVTITVYIAAGVLCFGSSTIFHTYYCHSQQTCRRLSQLDYIGIGLLMCSAFFPALHLGFACDGHLQWVYIALIAVMSVVVTVIHSVPAIAASLSYMARLTLFFAIAMFAFVPLAHWVLIRGPGHPELSMVLWRMCVMFFIFGCATAVYVFRVPERWWPGRFDIWGHSHQWWHVLVVATFLWHFNTILALQQHRREMPCSVSLRLSGSLTAALGF
jgi:adiponectin receptor